MYTPYFLQDSADDSESRRARVVALNELPKLRELADIVRVCKQIRTEAKLTDEQGNYAGRVHADGSHYLKGGA